MKNMKKILALVVAALMIVASTSAMAASITLYSGDTHTYKVFQVLTGTLSEEGSKQLGNPKWGEDATTEAKAGNVNDFIAQLTAATSEHDIAQLVASKVDTTGDGRGTVSADNPLNNLATGYYVLVDQTALTGDHELETKSLNVVQVLNDATPVRIKYDSTSDDKIIVSDSLGTNNATNNNNTVYEDGKNDGKNDNVSIGDTVNYQIKAKVPNTTKDYDFFYFIINDTLSKGLTLDANSIKVYHSAVDADHLIAADTETTENANGYNTRIDAAAADGSVSFHIGLKNAKAYNNEYIYVTYSAVLNQDALIGDDANPNTSTVKFSNNPNDDYDGTQDDDEPGFPADDKTPVLGETPQTRTETFTTAIKIQKVDENGNVLKGAGFTITGESVQTVMVSNEEFTNVGAGAGKYYKLKNDTYTTQEPVGTDYMREAAAGATAGWVKTTADDTDANKKQVGSDWYRPYKASDGNVQVYILVKANADQYTSDGKVYDKTVTYTAKDTTQTGVTATQMVGDDGVVIFKGLGAGTYHVTESTTPSGYNTIPAFDLKIDFTVPAAASNDPHWSVGTNSKDGWTYDAATGMFTITVENKKGTELPETGGMGTTILYIGGSILVILAAVLLITKRRMSAND